MNEAPVAPNVERVDDPVTDRAPAMAAGPVVSNAPPVVVAMPTPNPPAVPAPEEPMNTEPPTAKRTLVAGFEVAMPTVPPPSGVVDEVEMVKMTCEVVADVEVAIENAPTLLFTRVPVARPPNAIWPPFKVRVLDTVRAEVEAYDVTARYEVVACVEVERRDARFCTVVDPLTRRLPC